MRKQRSKGQSPQPLRISVIGGGYTGVELASTVAERFGPQARVQIIEPSDTIVASGVQGNREAAKKVRPSSTSMMLALSSGSLAFPVLNRGNVDDMTSIFDEFLRGRP